MRKRHTRMNPSAPPEPEFNFPSLINTIQDIPTAQPNLYGNIMGVVETTVNTIEKLDSGLDTIPDKIIENISEGMNVPLTQQENIYEKEDRFDNPEAKKDDFPDPSNHVIFWRFLVGMSYPFEAIKLCFTKYYAIVAFFDSILITFVILGSLALGCTIGSVIVTKSIAQPVNEWLLLWKFIWYNVYVLWILLILLLCAVFSSLFMLFGLFVASFFINQNSVKLSYLVEKEMTGGKIDYHELCFGEEMDRNTFGTMVWVKDYFRFTFMSYVKRMISMAKNMVRRYAIKTVQFLITRLITAIVTVPIPGFGAVAYFFIFCALFLIEIPSLDSGNIHFS
jgi:hypothetical protein